MSDFLKRDSKASKVGVQDTWCFCQQSAKKPLSIVLAVKLARLTVDEGGVERDKEADWGEEHLDGPDEVLDP